MRRHYLRRMTSALAVLATAATVFSTASPAYATPAANTWTQTDWSCGPGHPRPVYGTTNCYSTEDAPVVTVGGPITLPYYDDQLNHNRGTLAPPVNTTVGPWPSSGTTEYPWTATGSCPTCSHDATDSVTENGTNLLVCVCGMPQELGSDDLFFMDTTLPGLPGLTYDTGDCPAKAYLHGAPSGVTWVTLNVLANPSTSVTINPPVPNGTNGWWTGATVTFTCTPQVSPCGHTYYQISTDSGATWGTTQTMPWSGAGGAQMSTTTALPNGSTKIRFWSDDLAGDVETV